MNQLNSIILEGNLVRDAAFSEPVPGFKVVKFSVAVNRFYKNHNNEGIEEVSYFDVEAYGKMAEYCAEKGKKGRGIRVVGRLKQSVWKDEDDKTCSKIYIIAEHLEYKPVLQKTETKKETSVQETEVSKSVPVEVPAEQEAVAVF